MLTGHFVRGGAGTAGIGEDVHIRKAAFSDKGQALIEFFLGFPGECHNHVRGDGTVREILLQKADTFQIPLGVVLTLHPLQHRIAAALHGQVELGT